MWPGRNGFTNFESKSSIGGGGFDVNFRRIHPSLHGPTLEFAARGESHRRSALSSGGIEIIEHGRGSSRSGAAKNGQHAAAKTSGPPHANSSLMGLPPATSCTGRPVLV